MNFLILLMCFCKMTIRAVYVLPDFLARIRVCLGICVFMNSYPCHFPSLVVVFMHVGYVPTAWNSFSRECLQNTRSFLVCYYYPVSYPNFVRGPLLDDMRLFFGPCEVLGTHH